MRKIRKIANRRKRSRSNASGRDCSDCAALRTKVDEIVKQGNSLRSHQNEVMNAIENSLAIELENLNRIASNANKIRNSSLKKASMIADLVRLVETDNEVSESFFMEDSGDSEVLSERIVTEVESSTSVTLSEDESTDDVTSLDDSEETTEYDTCVSEEEEEEEGMSESEDDKEGAEDLEETDTSGESSSYCSSEESEDLSTDDEEELLLRYRVKQWIEDCNTFYERGMMEVPEYFPTQTAAAPYVHPLEAETYSHTKGFYFCQMASSFPQLQTLTPHTMEPSVNQMAFPFTGQNVTDAHLLSQSTSNMPPNMVDTTAYERAIHYYSHPDGVYLRAPQMSTQFPYL